MARDDTTWQVLPHGELEPLAENLWWVRGALPRMKLRRTMVVARLQSGDLVLHSAIALDDDGMAALEALGRPAWLVVPNGWHRLDAPRYKARYPDMQVVCPAGARKQVSKKVEVDATYDALPQLVPEDDSVRLQHFGEDRGMEGAMLVRSADGVTVVLGDALFNLRPRRGLFWGIYARLAGPTGGPRVTLIGRIAMLRGKMRGAYRDWLVQTAANEAPVRLVPGHGRVVSEDAAEVMRQVASTL